MSEESKFDELTKALCVKSKELLDDCLYELCSAYDHAIDVTELDDQISQVKRASELRWKIAYEVRLLRAGKERQQWGK